ncbi:MAG: hypothetical protein ACREF7_02700 [Candidatus Saccharimonadales bacterium]
MSAVDSTFLIIASVCLSLFFLTLVGLTLYTWAVFSRLIRRAEAAINGVEAASNMIREASKRGASFMPLVGLLRYIFQYRNKKS